MSKKVNKSKKDVEITGITQLPKTNPVRNIAEPESLFLKVVNPDDAIKFVKEARALRQNMKEIVDATQLGYISEQDIEQRKNKAILDRLTTKQVDPVTGRVREYGVAELQKINMDKFENLPNLIKSINDNLNVLNPDSGQAKILARLTKILTSSYDVSKLQHSTIGILKDELEKLNNSILMSSVQKDLVLQVFNQELNDSIGKRDIGDTMNIINNTITNLEKYGLQPVAIEALFYPIFLELKKYASENKGRVFDEDDVTTLKRMAEKKLNKNITEEEIGMMIDRLGVTMKKDIQFVSDQLSTQVNEQ